MESILLIINILTSITIGNYPYRNLSGNLYINLKKGYN